MLIASLPQIAYDSVLSAEQVPDPGGDGDTDRPSGGDRYPNIGGRKKPGQVAALGSQ
jgi:hypothetical protein